MKSTLFKYVIEVWKLDVTEGSYVLIETSKPLWLTEAQADHLESLERFMEPGYQLDIYALDGEGKPLKPAHPHTGEE